MKNTKISIIIPAYNISAFLGRALDSILAQTHKNLEVIVVNDGSTDQTPSIINDYASRFACIKAIHKENGGVTSARLQGISEATGEWIGFVDGDDYVEPHMFERLLENGLAHNADISHCGYQMILPSGNIRAYYGTGSLVIQDTQTGIRDLLDNRFVEPSLWNKLYKKILIQKVLSNTHFDTSIRITEDFLMNYYFFRESRKSVFEDICPYHYIIRTNSAANAPTNIHHLKDPLTVKRIIFQETATNSEHHAIIANQLVRQLVSLSTLDVKKNPKLTLPIRTQARSELRSILPEILTSSSYSRKFKLMGLWTAVWPSSYALIHRLYEKITGIDKIYEK